MLVHRRGGCGRKVREGNRFDWEGVLHVQRKARRLGEGGAVCASVWRGDGGHGSEYLLLDWM